MRPRSVGLAATFLVAGGVIGLTSDLTIAGVTFLLWCTAWTWGPMVTLTAMVAGGAVLVGGKNPGVRIFAGLAAIGLITDIINLNIFGFALGIATLVQLKNPDTAAYYAGTWEPPFVEGLPNGETGVVIHTSFMPMAFFLFACNTRLTVDGEEQPRLPWGANAVPLSPGSHTLVCEVPYLTGPIHRASIDVEVKEGETTMLNYHAPGWLIFLKGTLQAR